MVARCGVLAQERREQTILTPEQAEAFLIVAELPKRITDAMDEVASRVMGHPVKIGG